MRTLVVSEWVTLDGVFDADTMNQWFEPYDSVDRQKSITEMVLGADAFLLGRVTYEMFSAYWPNVKNNDKKDLAIANKLNSAPKYVVSSTLKTADWNNSTIVKGNVPKEIMKLKQR
jgi:dihydrofolate reductase